MSQFLAPEGGPLGGLRPHSCRASRAARCQALAEGALLGMQGSASGLQVRRSAPPAGFRDRLGAAPAPREDACGVFQEWRPRSTKDWSWPRFWAAWPRSMATSAHTLSPLPAVPLALTACDAFGTWRPDRRLSTVPTLPPVCVSRGTGETGAAPEGLTGVSPPPGRSHDHRSPARWT